MSDYWKEFFDTNSRVPENSLLKQVGKTVNGQEVSEAEIGLIVDSIVKALRLNASDRLVDLCCGNGLITKRVARHVEEILAVDFSSGLIDVALKSCAADNIHYLQHDVTTLGADYFRGFTKVFMNEALQHFSAAGFSSMLAQMKDMPLGSRIFFGGVPHVEKLRAFYDTDEKYSFHLQREREGRPHIGHWWSVAEIEDNATDLGFSTTILAQNASMPSAHYRFDVLLQKI